MESINDIREQFEFTEEDQKNLGKLGEILLPFSDQLAGEFYDFLKQNPKTAAYFKTEEAVKRRKETFKYWFNDLFASQYDNRYLLRLQKIGKVHVKIGLDSYHVNASIGFVREQCRRQLAAQIKDGICKEDLLITLHKALDINLSIMTSSYQEEKLKKVFVSYKAEEHLVNFAERLLHGLNLFLTVGLLILAIGVIFLLGHDIFKAVTTNLEAGVIRALGSLLILWMMIELLHTQINHLRGGKFHVRIFLELALVAFIRKIFVASFEYKDPISFMLLMGALLILGIVYFLVAKVESKGKGQA
ncbi:MAG: protoglobin domain-containing protein [Desulfobulbaceae bacterium]|nr:protoglobin domain-containing protein [Desulfobulbaceae bacterium]